MGNLLRVLNDKGGSVPKVNLFVDFEKAQPTDAEKAVYEKVAAVLERAPRIIDELGGYTGAGEQIREAISKPSNEDTQEKAWNAVRPLVMQLKTYYEFCTELETALTSILSVLCSADMTAMSHLEMHQALTKQLAEILDFSLKFDDLKMNNPSIQNDFSYFRRTMSRKRLESNDPRSGGAASNAVDGEIEMRDDVANRMSLFYAHPTPLLNALSATTKRFVEMHSELPLENTTDCLSMVACVCRVMTENPNYYTRFENEETIYFCLRVMVGVIILYDHVHPVGAFAKNAPIDIHKSVKVLKDHSTQKTDGLLNALRYNTKHFNDEQTPKATKTLLSS